MLEGRLLLSGGLLPELVIDLASSPVRTVQLSPLPAAQGANLGKTSSIACVTHPLGALPALNSLPGAPATLYLNFTGSRLDEDFVAPQLGSVNLRNYHQAFDLDFDPTRFSDAEADAIYRIWRYVADDYAPFNVNVTTYNNLPNPGRGHSWWTIR